MSLTTDDQSVHRYRWVPRTDASSTIRKPADVPEYREHPDQWELLRHDAEDYFIVLRRRE